MNAPSPLLALTQGDPSGIGPDITLMTWLGRATARAPFYVVADPALLAARAALLGLDVPIRETTPAEAAATFATALPVVPTRGRVVGRPGQPSAGDAGVTIEAIETAVAQVHAGEAAAVVTNPISKQALYQAGFAHPGHTEFLGELAGRHWGLAAPRAVMMLWSEALAVVPVTIHIPLAAVPAALSASLLYDTAVIVDEALRHRFGVARPRLACAGLNPHAGEAGAMGREDLDLIAPTLERLRQRGIEVAGPLPADTMFTAEARSRYDVALAMYHDQALIPIKTLAFDDAVNLTLGLPFVRSSPDHGTAFDIAGTGTARPASLLAALRLAARLATPVPASGA